MRQPFALIMTVVRMLTRQQDRLRSLAAPKMALGLSLTVAVLALIGAGWVFGGVLHDARTEDLARLNASVQRFVLAHRHTWLTSVMRVITDLGGAAALIGVVLVVGVTWWWRQHTWRPLLMLAGAYAGAWVVSTTVKLLTHRARPPAVQAIARFAGYAFPSGHATHAMAVYGMLAALLATATCCRRRKAALWATAALLVGLIGVSRLYLGVHWLTDVLGGYVLGAAWLFILLILVTTRRARDPGPRARSR